MPKRKDEFVQEYLYEELPIPLHPPTEKKKANEKDRGVEIIEIWDQHSTAQGFKYCDTRSIPQ